MSRESKRCVPIRMSIFPASRFLESSLLFFLGAKAADHPDPHWKRRVAAPKCFIVLKSKHGGRRKHRDLFPVINCLECRPHRNFRFPVADVSAEQPVHRHRRFHILLHVCDRAFLVRRFLEFERVFEFPLKIRVRQEMRGQ